MGKRVTTKDLAGAVAALRATVERLGVQSHEDWIVSEADRPNGIPFTLFEREAGTHAWHPSGLFASGFLGWTRREAFDALVGVRVALGYIADQQHIARIEKGTSNG